MKKVLGQDKTAVLFKALADKTRLKIICALYQKERCVSELMEELDMAQSHVSHHLKILKNAGFVSARREAHKRCYTLNAQVRKNFNRKNELVFDLDCCEVRFKC